MALVLRMRIFPDKESRAERTHQLRVQAQLSELDMSLFLNDVSQRLIEGAAAGENELFFQPTFMIMPRMRRANLQSRN